MTSVTRKLKGFLSRNPSRRTWLQVQIDVGCCETTLRNWLNRDARPSQYYTRAIERFLEAQTKQ